MRWAGRRATGPPGRGTIDHVFAWPGPAHGRGERAWFRRRFAGLEVPKRYQTETDPDADFNGAAADPAAVEEAWAAWRGEVAFAEQFTRDHDLDFLGRDSEGEQVSLRELLVHMIEEYARHNGHADLLRERIDGRVGQ